MAIRHLCAFRLPRYPFRIPLHWDLRATISPKGKEQLTGETGATWRHPPPTGEGKERTRTSHHVTQDPLLPGQDSACRACQIPRVRFTSRHTEKKGTTL